MAIRIVAAVDPMPFKRVHYNGRKRYNEARYREYKQVVGYFARQAMRGRKPLKGALSIRMVVYKASAALTSSSWGDGDNFLKAIMDALEGICYENDAQIVEGKFIKREGSPKIEVELKNYEGDVCLVRRGI